MNLHHYLRFDIERMSQYNLILSKCYCCLVSSSSSSFYLFCFTSSNILRHHPQYSHSKSLPISPHLTSTYTLISRELSHRFDHKSHSSASASASSLLSSLVTRNSELLQHSSSFILERKGKKVEEAERNVKC